MFYKNYTPHNCYYSSLVYEIYAVNNVLALCGWLPYLWAWFDDDRACLTNIFSTYCNL